MRKFTGLVTVVVLALVLFSYYGMGYLTERQLKENLRVVNQSNGLSAEIREYHRGWFTSKILLDWRLFVPEHSITNANGQSETVPAQEYRMKMPLTIYHGPIMFPGNTVKFGFGYAHSALVLPPHLVQQFDNAFSKESVQPKLDLSLFVSYLNNTTVKAEVPKFQLIDKQGNGHLNWEGMTSKTTVSSDIDKVDGSLEVTGVQITKDQVKTTIKGVATDYDLHKTEAGIYLGDANFSFDSMYIENNNKKIFELNHFDVQSDTDIENGLFHSHFKSSVHKIVANDKIYGPGDLEVSIRNLDAPVLAKINEQFAQVQQGSEAARQQVLIALLPELPKLLSKGAEFEITKMNFVVPQGKIEANLLISLPKGDPINPFELLQKVQGNGKLKVPALVVKEILTESIKQRLMTAPQQPQNIQQSIMQEMQKQGKEPAATSEPATAPAANTTPAPGQAANPAETTGTPSGQPQTAQAVPTAANPQQIAEQAAVMADKQLALMVETGILVAQDKDYVLEVTLSQGKLLVNNKPFSPEMVKFR